MDKVQNEISNMDKNKKSCFKKYICCCCSCFSCCGDNAEAIMDAVPEMKSQNDENDESKTRDKALKFRSRFLQRLCNYIDSELKDQHSDLRFTLIYPIKMDDDTLWCYLRVSEGIIDLDDFEPTFHRAWDENEQLPDENQHYKLKATRAKIAKGKSKFEQFQSLAGTGAKLASIGGAISGNKSVKDLGGSMMNKLK